jgi:hypothetical protein
MTLLEQKREKHTYVGEMSSQPREHNRRVVFIYLLQYLPYEEEGDDERRHGGHQAKNQVLQLREPLHMAQEAKNGQKDNVLIVYSRNSTS